MNTSTQSTNGMRCPHCRYWHPLDQIKIGIMKKWGVDAFNCLDCEKPFQITYTITVATSRVEPVTAEPQRTA